MRYDFNRDPATPAEFWTVVVFVGIIFLGVGLEIFTNYQPGKAVILFFFLFWMPLIVVHELGHAWMAGLLGWHVSHVVVGLGKVMRHFRVGRQTVELRLIPLEGFALIGPPDGKFGGWRHALIYFAGPGIELVIFFVLLSIFGWTELTTLSDSLGMTAIQGLAIAALIGAVLNLIPHAMHSGDRWIANDGLGILQSLFWSDRSPRSRSKHFTDEPDYSSDPNDPADWWKR